MANAAKLLGDMTPSDITKIKVHDMMDEIRTECEIYAKLRRAQFNAYKDEGFSTEQAMELLKIPRAQI
ncbi:hypothetical protein JQX09_17630 [Sulfitobacter pseudonitzschiae]|uniref:Uncharacterized protein n=1 Tax=Pseudosulfitobacter pseudonitzschiae TaxID=1402135 RepID=A0A9Q2NKN5_9RHOB|nr:hypothetical protein [Pseudosulfitobacter pseudonitzschiae]MBM2293753.1 hypothetical protein [Pseudosulfitobacter pseudonitzschiae]MBM2298671.1 hypothetical protein [Pseudosulfitobacter pseudonitzschiae]MBM2303585.1 hypothetical protein [Pseudosulfitobacter pseudonitzschiae]MBM2313368.1 hypothetical protein [Pseudosulfitobacter pseudonitzschiae]MBM2318281.1 hypothetical protein [Pseudosulfitobacter pseudonitzschiae]